MRHRPILFSASWVFVILVSSWFCLPPLARSASIELPSGQTLSGTIDSKSPDTLTITTNAGPQLIKLGDASRITFAEPEVNIHGLRAEYFANDTFTGPSTTRLESDLNFHWLTHPTDSARKDRTFSLRLTGTLLPLFTEDYFFYLNATDRTRLFIDDRLAVDAAPSNQQTRSSPTHLTAGSPHSIRIEYANMTNDPHLFIYWSSPSLPRQLIASTALSTPLIPHEDGSGLNAEYFATPDLQDSRGKRIDNAIAFNWREDPISNLPRDAFSVRWSGSIKPRYSETYTFTTRTDDGVRLWINDKPVIDQWQAQPVTEVTGKIQLQANTRYAIRMEYFQAGGEAVAELLWSSPSQAREIIPSSRLYPTLPTATQAPHGNAVPAAPGDAIYSPPPAALLLRDGSLVAGRPTGLAAKTLKFVTPWRKDLSAITDDDIAYFFVRPLTDEQRALLAHPTPQAILVSGDSVEGRIADWTNNRIRLSSVVFGLYAIDITNELVALSINPPKPSAPPTATPYTLRLRDGSILHVTTVHLDSATTPTLTANHPILGPLTIPLSALVDLAHTTK